MMKVGYDQDAHRMPRWQAGTTVNGKIAPKSIVVEVAGPIP